MERIEAGSYRITHGKALFAIETWLGKWEVLPLNQEAEDLGEKMKATLARMPDQLRPKETQCALEQKDHRETTVLGQFKTLKKATLFTKIVASKIQDDDLIQVRTLLGLSS